MRIRKGHLQKYLHEFLNIFYFYCFIKLILSFMSLFREEGHTNHNFVFITFPEISFIVNLFCFLFLIFIIGYPKIIERLSLTFNQNLSFKAQQIQYNFLKVIVFFLNLIKFMCHQSLIFAIKKIIHLNFIFY